MSKLKYSLDEFHSAIANGNKWLIYDSKIYDMTNWINKHPGGKQLINLMIGFDATHQINGNHNPKVINILSKYLVAELQTPNSSSLDKEFSKLCMQLQSQGLYNTDYSFYYTKAIMLLVVFSTMVTMVVLGPESNYNYFGASLLLALFWHQMSFIAHDTGHVGITHSSSTDYLIGVFLANFMGGVSIGWWKNSHYTHHLVTNDPCHDPDIQHLPFFAVSTKFFKNLYSTYYNTTLHFDSFSKFFVQFQHYTYYIVLFFGRFNMYSNSFRYLMIGENVRSRMLEISGILFFWVWYTALLSYIPTSMGRFLFILLSNGMTFLLHVQITLSHFSVSTEVLTFDEEFIRHQLRTTMNVDCPPWLDWFHGGLQFQIEHHLFPRMPRHNLRKVSTIVQEFCKKNDLFYNMKTFTKGNIQTIQCLADVANQVQFLTEVATTNPHSHTM